MHDRQAHVQPIMTYLVMRLLETTHVPDNLVLPYGVSLLGDLLEAEISFNAITTVSNGAYSLSRIIKLDPTHMSEARS